MGPPWEQMQSRSNTGKVHYRNEDYNNTWKIKLVKEIIEVKNETLGVENFTKDELDEVLMSICLD